MRALLRAALVRAALAGLARTALGAAAVALALGSLACAPAAVSVSPTPVPPSGQSATSTPPRAAVASVVAGQALGVRSKTTGCAVHAGLPDPACTPGAVFADVTAGQICQGGYATSVRDVPSEESRSVYLEYGIAVRTGGEFEVDHLVPLETGGSNDIANLWPEAAEPRPGFHEKDLVENYLHDQVCAGGMTLLDAQRAIASNWLDVYVQRGLGAPRLAVPQPTPGSGVQITVTSAPGSGVQITVASGARPGGRASLTAQTGPGVVCSIAYRTPAGSASTAQGLAPQTADGSGLVSWSWDISASTRPGTGTVAVTCAGGTARGSIPIE